MNRYRSQAREVINRNTVVSLAGRDKGAYSRPRLSAAAISQCAPYRFSPIWEVAAKAAEEAAE